MNILLRRINSLKLIYCSQNTYQITQVSSVCTQKLFVLANSKNIFVNSNVNNWNKSIQRFKSKQRKQSEDNDDDDRFELKDDDSSLSKDSKVIKFSTTSLRTDGILKNALGIARNKIEKYFYESRLRVNGRKILKKSVPVREGDEIDVIKSVSLKNPDHLQVARVEILNVTAEEESISITARRFKNLLIENYEEDPFKGTIEDEGYN